MSEKERIREHWRIIGDVQGVGFRWGMQQIANSLGITGWVRNLYSGDVEAEIQGTEYELEVLENRLREGRYYGIRRIWKQRIPAEDKETAFRVRMWE